MKKWELLKYAYDNYPARTKCKGMVIFNGQINDNGEPFEASGQYHIEGVSIVDSNGWVIYFGAGKWAEIVKPSILDGKVAIRVDNEREFKLLMEHYESKGWRVFSGAPIEEIIRLNTPNPNLTWSFHDKFSALNTLNKMEGYKIIPFADFAAEVGITVPKFIMKSEDGVDLYEGDEYFVAHSSSDKVKWTLLSFRGDYTYKIDSNSVCLESERFFSTREAAEKWIEEQNRHNEIEDATNDILAFLDNMKKSNKPVTWLTKWVEEDHCSVMVHVKSLQQ